MNIYLLSDLHLGRDMSKFGNIWQEHKTKIELYWNKFIADDDIILMPGDLSWGRTFEQAQEDIKFIHSLVGTKIITQGNHDWWLNSFDKASKQLPQSIIAVNWNKPYLINGIVIGGSKGSLVPGDKYFVESKHRNSYERNKEKVSKTLENLADFKKSAETKISKTIFMLHFAPNKYYGEINEYADLIADSKIVDICVYGHLHSPEEWNHALQNNYKGVEFHLGSCDYLNFIPKLILKK